VVGLLAGILFAAGTWALYGYSFATSSNHAFYLPYVEWLLNSSLYPGDVSIVAAAAAPGWFWPGLAAGAKFIGIERAAFTLWFCSRVLGGWAAWSCAQALGGGARGGWLAVFFTACTAPLFIDAPLAGDPLFKNFVDQTSFAWPFALWAVALWLQRRHAASFVLLGLSANLNPLVAGITASWLTVGGLIEESDDAGAMAKHLGLFALCALPVLWQMGTSGTGGDIHLLTAVTPNTYLPIVWSWERWVNAACWLMLWGAVFSVHSSSRNLSSLLIAVFVLWALYVVAARITPLRALLQLQLLRLDAPLAWLAAVAAGVLIGQWTAVQKAPTFLPSAAVGWVFAAVQATGALALWGVGLVMLENTDRRRAMWAFAGAAWAVISMRLAAGNLWALPPNTALATFLFAGMAAVGGWTGRRPWRRRRHRAVLAALLVVALLPSIRLAAARQERVTAPVQRPVEVWARQTPRETLFIVSPGESGFRLRVKRPVYFEWTDFNAAVYNKAAGGAWRRRLEALGTDVPAMTARRAQDLTQWDRALIRGLPADRPTGPRAWRRSDSGRLAALARRVGASYIVAPATSKLELPQAQIFKDTVVYGPFK
jgi:hypothetical protein